MQNRETRTKSLGRLTAAATIGEALATVNLATMDKSYLPEVVAWVKALLAKA